MSRIEPRGPSFDKLRTGFAKGNVFIPPYEKGGIRGISLCVTKCTNVLCSDLAAGVSPITKSLQALPPLLSTLPFTPSPPVQELNHAGGVRAHATGVSLIATQRARLAQGSTHQASRDVGRLPGCRTSPHDRAL